MAIPWLSLLKTVPWVDVIRSAPVVADGAKKLWNSVGKKTPSEEPPPEPVTNEPSPEAEAHARLMARLASMEETAKELHQQVLASTELITALADQNAELVKRVEANRVRLIWLSVGMALLAALLLASLWFRA